MRSVTSCLYLVGSASLLAAAPGFANDWSAPPPPPQSGWTSSPSSTAHAPRTAPASTQPTAPTDASSETRESAPPEPPLPAYVPPAPVLQPPAALPVRRRFYLGASIGPHVGTLGTYGDLRIEFGWHARPDGLGAGFETDLNLYLGLYAVSIMGRFVYDAQPNARVPIVLSPQLGFGLGGTYGTYYAAMMIDLRLAFMLKFLVGRNGYLGLQPLGIGLPVYLANYYGFVPSYDLLVSGGGTF